MAKSAPLTREDHDEAFAFMEMAEVGIPSVRVNIVAIRMRFFFWNISTEINGVLPILRNSVEHLFHMNLYLARAKKYGIRSLR